MYNELNNVEHLLNVIRRLPTLPSVDKKIIWSVDGDISISVVGVLYGDDAFQAVNDIYGYGHEAMTIVWLVRGFDFAVLLNDEISEFILEDA